MDRIMSQTYTSAKTSMNARKLPKVFGKLPDLPRRSFLFDYGCGKFTDHIDAAVRARGLVYLPFDPFNQPDTVNATAVCYLKYAVHMRYPVTVVCSNVLNVIDSDEEVYKIARTIMEIVPRTGGQAYVTVYAGDRSGIGRQTGPDQYQRNQPLEAYLPQFSDMGVLTWYGKRYKATAHIERGMIVAGCEEVQ